MILRRARRDAGLLLLLFVLPAVACAPLWWDGRLLGPGDGTALHFPLRCAAWDAWRAGELPGWNPSIFLGTPLLASYRPGALYPPMIALALLPDPVAFQALVLGSLGAAGVVVFLYLRRLGAERMGAFVGGLGFALGPYLVAHLGDTATVVAAPLLPLVLLAAESHVNRASPGRAAGLAAALALLALAGSPEAARAGAALVVGRLVVGHLVWPNPKGPTPAASLAAVGAGLLLAAPQILPTLVAASAAGRSVTGLAGIDRPLPGLFGLILRYASHTPAGALALAALPLAASRMPVRVLGLALAICLALQWGQGPLSAPGALALVFDLTLCVLAGLSLSAQWSTRREALGARLRAYFLTAALASAAALSVAAAAVAPLPDRLAAAVGVLALSLILYFSLARSPSSVRAAVWLLPLTVSFLLEPASRHDWTLVPRAREIAEGTATRREVERAMGAGRGERALALVRDWPAGEERDLGYANWAALSGGRSANGYDPMVPLRTRTALGGMSAGGTVPPPFLRSDPARLEMLGTRWVMVPASALAVRGGSGLSEPLEMPLRVGERRFFPLPISAATEVRMVSMLSEAVGTPQDEPVALLRVRLASGRDFELPVRAGVHTGEWARDRQDVRGRVAHAAPPVFESWPENGFEGHRYLGTVSLPGRYVVDGIGLEALPGKGRLTVSRLAVADARRGQATPVSLAAAFVSDPRRFVEVANTPVVRLYQVAATSRAWVVGQARTAADDRGVEGLSAALTASGVDPRGVALVTAADAKGLVLPRESRPGRAEVVRAAGGRLDVRAEGPGLLVVSEGWDLGWSAEVDGAPARAARVNGAEIGVPLEAGRHRVLLRYRPPGWRAGLALAALGALSLLVWVVRGRGI